MAHLPKKSEVILLINKLAFTMPLFFISFTPILASKELLINVDSVHCSKSFECILSCMRDINLVNIKLNGKTSSKPTPDL